MAEKGWLSWISASKQSKLLDHSQKGQLLLILKYEDDLEVVPGANAMFSTYTTFSTPQFTAGERGVWQMS